METPSFSTVIWTLCIYGAQIWITVLGTTLASHSCFKTKEFAHECEYCYLNLDAICAKGLCLIRTHNKRLNIRKFTKPRRQRERHRTKELMSTTIAVHNSIYISLTHSVIQRRDMTKFCVVWRMWTTTDNFLFQIYRYVAGYRHIEILAMLVMRIGSLKPVLQFVFLKYFKL